MSVSAAPFAAHAIRFTSIDPHRRGSVPPRAARRPSPRAEVDRLLRNAFQ